MLRNCLILASALLLSACLGPAETLAAASQPPVPPAAVQGVTAIPSLPAEETEVYLPLVTEDWNVKTIQPASLEYLGAFRLPVDGDRPLTFAYGGSSMAFRPDGDPGGSADGFSGSLYIMGHDRLPYGELPDGNQVAEVSIPAPVISTSLDDLSRAAFLQPFHDIAAGQFTGLDEIPRTAMLYLDNPLTGPLVHLAWGAHFQEPPQPSHAWFSPDLDAPAFTGAWYIDDESLYSTNNYLLEIPAEWAAAYTGGLGIGTGRFRDGGWSGMGPQLYAYLPWQADGQPYPAGTHLDDVTLLRYTSSTDTEAIEGALQGYQHPDEWEGAAFLTTPDGRAAVVFVGTKGVGAKYWYGYVNPAGPEFPCVDAEAVTDFTGCRLANGEACPPADLVECDGHTSARGWWSSAFEAQMIFYDPADLARVASGEWLPNQPQPYAVLSLDEHLFFNPPAWDLEALGTGVQRRNRIGEAAYDRANNILYVLEWFGDEAQPVVHAWRVR